MATTLTATLRASASHSMHVSVARLETGSLSLTVDVTVQIAAKVSESGKLFGAVTTAQVAEALAGKGFEIDKKNITLEAVKELGTFEASVKCYKSVKGSVKVEVVAE